MNNPEYLYQYTSLETLAIILKDNNLKFSRLSRLDDPLEKYVSRITYSGNTKLHLREDLGDYCFVSCWSKGNSGRKI